MRWDIRRTGRAWSGVEARERWALTAERIEMIEGRLNMLALLLENVGADAAVRLGDPEVWREAVAARPG